MQQIYRRSPMPKCDFNKAALQKLNLHKEEPEFNSKARNPQLYQK